MSHDSFRVFGTLGAFGETGPKDPQIMGMDTREVIESVKLEISHQMISFTRVQPLSEGQVIPVLVHLGHWGISRKLDPNILKIM